MRSAFEQRLRHVRRRCHGNLLLELLAWALAAAGAAGAVLVAEERFFALGILRPWGLPALAALAAVLAAGLWAARRPSLLSVAVLIDRELGLKERMSTSLALAGSEDPFAVAARAEAHRTAGRIDLKGKFPIRFSRRWLWSAASWAAAIATLLFLPPLDLLGREGRQKARQEEARQLAGAREEVRQAIEKIDMKVSQMPDKSLSAELAKAADAKDAMKAEDVKHQAIRKLEELADKIKKIEAAPKAESMKDLSDMLKGLRSPANSALPQLNRDIAKGDFHHAADLLRDVQKQLEDGKLTKEQKEALAKQLGELGKQLEEMAGRNKELQEALQEAGLSKDLAGLSGQEFKDALEKQKSEGMSQEKIDELMKKAEACRKACEQLKKLGKCMGGCCPGGDGEQLTPDELAALLDELGDLEGEMGGLALTDEALEEIEDAIARLGGQGPWEAGVPRGVGLGTGGPGIGLGPRKSDDSGNVKTEKTRVEGPQKDGPTVASWYFKGPQVTGESKKQLQEVVKAARDAAAEAINENEIPRKYELPVKTYFGDLEEATTRPAR